MKRFLIALIILTMPILSSYANDASEEFTEVSLESEQIEILEDSTQAISVSEDSYHEEKSLREKLKDVYNLEITEYNKPSYLFEEILTKKYSKDSIIEKTHLWGAYNGYLRTNFSDNGNITNHYDFNAVNLGLDGTFKNNSADFRIMLGISPRSERNIAQGLFSDVYIATNKIPHHRLILGHIRPPVGMEGGSSAYTLPFLSRAQISRNFGMARKVGFRAIGNYSLVDYDLGVYSSDTFFQEFFPGAEFVGWVNLKPLEKTNGKYGNLKIGAGLDAGNRDYSFCVTGLYAGWEYKRFMANFEWANADGYNGYYSSAVKRHASGFYTTIGYMLTKKLQLIARYDEFEPNKDTGLKKREYSVGLNYFIKGQALRLILNYVFCQNDGQNDSHRIIFGTQILI